MNVYIYILVLSTYFTFKQAQLLKKHMCHIVPFKSLFHPAPTLAKKGNADAQRLLPQRRFFGSLLERTCNDN